MQQDVLKGAGSSARRPAALPDRPQTARRLGLRPRAQPSTTPCALSRTRRVEGAISYWKGTLRMSVIAGAGEVQERAGGSMCAHPGVPCQAAPGRGATLRRELQPSWREQSAAAGPQRTADGQPARRMSPVLMQSCRCTLWAWAWPLARPACCCRRGTRASGSCWSMRLPCCTSRACRPRGSGRRSRSRSSGWRWAGRRGWVGGRAGARGGGWQQQAGSCGRMGRRGSGGGVVGSCGGRQAVRAGGWVANGRATCLHWQAISGRG